MTSAQPRAGVIASRPAFSSSSPLKSDPWPRMGRPGRWRRPRQPVQSRPAYPDTVALIKAVMVPLDASAEDLQTYVDVLTADPPPLEPAPTPDTDESADDTT
jgi:hypothetical protein